MNGVRAPAGGLARRFLRRSVLVAAFAGAGWLLAALFAGGASAAPAPAQGEVPVTAQAANPADQPASPEAAPADSAGSPAHSTTPPTDVVVRPAAPAGRPTQPATHEAAPATGRPAPADRPTHEAAPANARPASPAGRPTEQPTHDAAAATSRPSAPTDRPARQPGNSAHPHAQEVAPVAELFAAQALVSEAVPADQLIARLPAIGPAAPVQPAPQNNSLLSGLLGGLANTVGTITESVAGTVDDAVSDMPAVSVMPVVIVPPTNEPDGILPELPQLLPILGTDPEPLPARGPAARATPHAPAAPRAPPPATTAIPVPEHPPGQVAFSAPPQRTPDKSGGATRGTAAEHANESSVPRPVKVPAPAPAPAGGPTASTVHDNSAGARGTHGVLAARTSLEPSAAGFTTRSRATGLSGRIAGLPATSPD